MVEKEKKEEDKQIDAAKTENVQVVDERLVAPLPAPDPTLPEQKFIPNPIRGTTAEGKPRQKTFGENLFDWSVYAGIGWIANEFLSGIINDKTVYKGAPFYKAYHQGLTGLQNGLQKITKMTPERALKWVERPFNILILTIGGNLLVLPMKWAEDHKGALVRFADRMIHGNKVDTDPTIQEAHKEMDESPKQSWGSLGQSRLITMAGAVGIDYAMGAKDAWSTKLFKSEGAKKWASLNNINVSLFRSIAKFAEKHFGFDRGVTKYIDAAEKLSPFEIVDKKLLDHLGDDEKSKALKALKSEGKIASFGKSFGFIFLLSGVLAGTFYITSRIFAFNREQKKHPTGEHTQRGTAHIGLDNEPVLEREETQDKPKTKVSTVALDKAINTERTGVMSIT